VEAQPGLKSEAILDLALMEKLIVIDGRICYQEEEIKNESRYHLFTM
jgi:hypothetical protein